MNFDEENEPLMEKQDQDSITVSKENDSVIRKEENSMMEEKEKSYVSGMSEYLPGVDTLI